MPEDKIPSSLIPLKLRVDMAASDEEKRIIELLMAEPTEKEMIERGELLWEYIDEVWKLKDENAKLKEELKRGPCQDETTRQQQIEKHENRRKWIKTEFGEGLERAVKADDAEQISEILPEVRKLYTLTVSKEQMPDGITNTKDQEAVFKGKAHQQWKKFSWTYITEESLDINYRFASGKERRDFITRVLQKILEKRGISISATHIRESLS